MSLRCIPAPSNAIWRWSTIWRPRCRTAGWQATRAFPLRYASWYRASRSRRQPTGRSPPSPSPAASRCLSVPIFSRMHVGILVVAEDRFEPPTHGSKVGWPKEYDCTERGIHYFVRLKRRSPCLERPGIRPFLSIAHPRSARPGSPPDRESRRSRYTRTVGGIAQAQKFRLLHPDIALGCVALLRL